MAQLSQKQSRIYYSGAHDRYSSDQQKQPKDVDELIACVDSDRVKGVRGVCIIENISAAMFRKLCDVWSIDANLLDDHFANPAVNRLWGKMGDRPVEPVGKGYYHLDGIHQYHSILIPVERLRAINPNHCYRHIYQETSYPPSSNTRVTYSRPLLNVYLFLVDAPLPCAQAFPELAYPRFSPTLRFPYSQNYGGVLIPSIGKDGPICNLFNVFRSVFEHPWQVRLLLFESKELFPPSALVYVLSNSVWETKFRALDAEMKRISFTEIRNPDLKIEDSLHDLRADLALLRSVIAETISFVPPHITESLKSIANLNTNMTPIIEQLKKLEKRAADLHTFFVETIQLLAITISIRDSQANIEQSKESLKQTKQGIYLTRLAALYLPLSVATGVFGMNLKEINQSSPAWWTFLVVLVGLSLVTFTLLWVGTGSTSRSKKEKRRGVSSHSLVRHPG